MNPRMRVSDAERQDAIADLERHTHDGRLTLEEFDERSRKAWDAQTGVELDTVTSDLPALRESPNQANQPSRWTAPGLTWKVIVIVLLAVMVGMMIIAGIVHLAGGTPMGEMGDMMGGN